MLTEKTTYTVGILGAGQIVINMHLPVLLAMPECEVAWLSDVNPQRAREVGEAFGIPAFSAKPEDLPETDAVLIAVPYGVREPIYETLRKRRNTLYVEKPFARTLDQHQKYLSWFAHSQVAIGFQKRALGSAAVLRKLIESQTFGRLVSVRVEHGMPGVLTGSSYSADFRLAGGGLLFEVGIHWIDLALFIMGATSARVTQGRMIREGGFDLDTEASFLAQTGHQQDVTFEVLATGLRDARNATIYRFFGGAELVFTHGDAKIALPISLDQPNVELTSPLQSYPVSAHQLCREMWSGLFDSIRTGVPNMASAQNSVVTTSVIESLYGLSG